jgi:hypothetical protein
LDGRKVLDPLVSDDQQDHPVNQELLLEKMELQ